MNSGTRQDPESLLQGEFSGNRCHDRVCGARCLLAIHMFERKGEQKKKLKYRTGLITAPFNPKGIFEDRIARQGASDCLAPSVEHMTPDLVF